MARRRKKNDDNIVGSIAQLVGLAVLAAMFIPGVRQLLLLIGIIAVGLLVLLVVGFVVYRLLTRERRWQPVTENVFTNPVPVSDRARHVVEVRPKLIITARPTTEIMEQLRSMDWFQFEKLVEHIYKKKGYIVTRRGGANPDGGIDLIVKKDGQCAAVQCKQWKTWNVGVKAIREFLGALTDAGIQKGIFITVRGYTGEARQLAEKHGIEILNETGLARMLDATDGRFDPHVLELLHDTRKFCPKCERELVVRTAEKGPNRGGKFWGCSGFQQGCRFTMPVN